MAEQKTFEQYFGTIGEMMCAGGIGSHYQDSPLKDAVIEVTSKVQATLQGTVTLPTPLLVKCSWLPGSLEVSGTVDSPSFILEGTLGELPPLPPISSFLASSVRIRMENRKWDLSDAFREELGLSEEEGLWESEIQVFVDGKIGSEEGTPVTFGFYPMRAGDFTEYYGNFGSGKQAVPKLLACPEGSPVRDASAFVLECLGISPDFASLIPPGIPFLERIRPGSFLLTVKKDAATGESKIQSFSLRLYYGSDAELFQAAGISFSRLYLELSGDSLPSVSKLYPAFGGMLETGGIEISFRFAFPYTVLTVDTQHYKEKVSQSIADLAAKLSFSVPPFFAGVVIDQVLIQMDLANAWAAVNFRFSNSSLKRLENSPSDSCSLKWKETEIRLRVGNGQSQVGVASVLLLYDGTQCIGTFVLRGEWTKGVLGFKGQWSGTATFNRLYSMIFGQTLPQAVPTFSICELSLWGKVTTTLSLERISGRVEVEMADTALIGYAFKLTAQVQAADGGFSCKGLLAFGDYFTIEATYTWRKTGGYAWGFTLLAAQWRIGVSYDGRAKKLSGQLSGACTFGNLVDGLLRAISPSQSFRTSGVWSFLDSLNFAGCEFTYFYDTKKMKFSLSIQYKNAFLEMSRLAVTLGREGIDIQIVGKFMGTVYTEGEPLSFQPNQPPDTGGRGFSMNYLSLSDGIVPPYLSGISVEQDMKTLKEAWNKSTKLETLNKQPQAGVVFAMDMFLASMVQVQLLYREGGSYCGGRFVLNGKNAGAFKGLEAELSYGKLQNDLGVFSGKFKPSENMKLLSLGAVQLGLGEVEALVYTNGDFFIDVGYPKNLDFSRSFSVSYGLFQGKGGIYVRKSTRAANAASPYTWAFHMGLGLRISLGTDYSASMFSASATVTMTGCFEGMYGTKSAAAGLDEGEYELSATAQFQGILQGSVDFGIIGASVSVELLAKADVVLKSAGPTEVALYFQVRANASVRAAFIRISFGFSINGYLQFSLGDKNRPWPGIYQRQRRPLYIKRSDTIQRFTLRLVPVFSVWNGENAVNLFFMMDHDDFERMLVQFEKVMRNVCGTGALDSFGDVCGLELFDRLRYLQTKEELYELLSKNFIFRLEPFTDPSVYKRNPVMFPLPEFVRQVVATEYSSGQRDLVERELNTYAYAGDDYVEYMRQYYAETQEKQDLVQEDTVSMTARIFMDFFELIFRSLRAEAHQAKIKNERFDVQNLSGTQLLNMQGMTNRFLLGGSRGIRKSTGSMCGTFFISGQQVLFIMKDNVKRYRFALEPLKNLPGWLEFPETGKVEMLFDRERVKSYCPAARFSGNIFTSTPAIAPFYTEEKEPSPALTPLFTVDTKVYYNAASGIKRDGSYPRYGGIFWLLLQPASEDAPVFSVIEYGDTRYLSDCANSADTEALEFIYTDDEGVYHTLDSGKLFCVGSSRDGQRHQASLLETTAFLDITDYCLKMGLGFYIAFSEGDCPLSLIEQSKIYVVVKMKDQSAYQTFCTCIVGAKEEELILYPQKKAWKQRVEFGNFLLYCQTSEASLSEEEKRLYDMYSNMGTELVYNGKVTHETPPCINSDAGAERVYKVPVPFGRACGEGEHPYAMIAAAKPLTIRPFLIDMLGNRMDIGKDFTWIPVYTDRLIGLWEYPGISLESSYQKKGNGTALTFTLCYEPDETSEADKMTGNSAWERGLLQLRQEDVYVGIHTSLQKEAIAIDRKGLVEFLEKCKADPGHRRSLKQERVLEHMVLGPIFSGLTQELSISRRRQFCLLEGPKEIQNIKRDVRLVPPASAELPLGMHLFHSWNQWYVLLLGSDKLVKSAILQESYGFLPLPAVSGIFKDGNREYVISGLGLNALLDDFLRDMQQLFRPDTLYTICTSADLKGYLEQLYGIRESAAKALSARVMPFGSAATPSMETKMREMARQFFLQRNVLNRKNLIFIQGAGELKNTFSMGYSGVLGEGDGFPAWFDLERSSFVIRAVIQAADILPPGNLEFTMKYLKEKERNISYSPLYMAEGTECFSLKLEKEIKPPVQLPPEAPVLLSYETGEKNVLTLSLRPTADTQVCIKWKERQRYCRVNGVENWVLPAMERYRRESPALLQELTAENLKALLNLMTAFCKAVEDFPVNKPYEAGTHSWRWKKNAGGHLTGLTAAATILEEGWEFYYQTDTSALLKMKRETGGYDFLEEAYPGEGKVLLMRIFMPKGSKETVKSSGQISVIQDGNCKNPAFCLHSPAVEF